MHDTDGLNLPLVSWAQWFCRVNLLGVSWAQPILQAQLTGGKLGQGVTEACYSIMSLMQNH